MTHHSQFVTVKADDLGNVINVSENSPEFGYVRVQQLVPVISNTGWAKPQKRSALIKGKIEDLKMFGFKENESIPGKIVVRESFMPFNAKDSERDLKIAGDTGIICRVDDQPIYRQTFFTYDVNAQDELIAHTNTDEIREVALASREMSAILSHHDRKAAEANL